jgi:hypothetical protein
MNRPDLPLEHDPAEDSERDPVDVATEEFVVLLRRGEAPSVETYASAHPDLADELRALLPAVSFLERSRQSASASGGRQAAPLLPSVPERLGENRILRELGRGGMGIVYEAVQEPLGRHVAVKVLPRYAPADSSARKRFLREARAIALLDHPHIVPIHAVGEQDGLAYYVMALVRGRGLDRVLDDPAALPPLGTSDRARRVADLGIQAAGALAYAHDQGVLHRDIKPANLLLDGSGTLYLTDFGLARIADDLSLTGTGELSGTLRYLPPESLHDQSDQRSDIYCLGLTLYELAVGRPAFPELNRARLLKLIENQDRLAPRDSVPTLDRDLETIILKAIDREPAARYADARELADDLTRFRDGRPILARRASLTERVVRSARRNPLVASLLTALALLSLVTAYFVRLYLISGPPAWLRGPGPGAAAPAGPARPPAFGVAPNDLPPPPLPADLQRRGPGFRQPGRPGEGPDRRFAPDDRPRGPRDRPGADVPPPPPEPPASL